MIECTQIYKTKGKSVLYSNFCSTITRHLTLLCFRVFVLAKGQKDGNATKSNAMSSESERLGTV